MIWHHYNNETPIIVKYSKLQVSLHAKEGRKTFLQLWKDKVCIFKLSQFSSNEVPLGKTLGCPKTQHTLHFLSSQQENKNALHFTESVTKRSFLYMAYTFEYDHN